MATPIIRRMPIDARLLNGGRGLSREMAKIVDEVNTGLARGASEIAKHSMGKAVSDRFMRASQKAASILIEGVNTNNASMIATAVRMARIEQDSIDKVAKKRVEAMRQAERIQKKGTSESVLEFTDGIGNAFSNISLRNIPGMLKGLGKGLEKTGGKAIAKSATMDVGMMSKAMAGMGSSLAAIGPAIAAIGGIAAALAALIALLIGAMDHGRKLNKTLMDTGVTAGDLTRDLNGTYDAINDVRNAFGAATAATALFKIKTGLTTEESLKAIGAFNKVGLTVLEMANGIDNASEAQARYVKHVEVAWKWSKLLGVSIDEAATMAGEQMESLGLTIEGVDERFASVYESASQSGFGVKRFFNMVLQATTGMSLYNVRMEEAAGLLTHFGRILGAQMGGDMLKSLTDSMKDESYKDSVKRVMTTGPKLVKDVLAKSAKHTATDFTDKMASVMEGPGGEKMAKALEKGGLGDLGFGSGGKLGDAEKDAAKGNLLAKLKGMSGDEQKVALASVRGENPELADKLQQLIDTQKGASGNLMASAGAIPGADLGAKLVLEINEMTAVLGKPLTDMNTFDKMTFQETTGKSRTQIEQLQRIAQGMEGNRLLLKKSGERDKSGKGVGDMAVLADRLKAGEISKEQFDTEMSALQKEQIAKYGAYADENGKVFSKSGDEIKNLNDMMMSQGDKLQKGLEEPMSAQEAATQQISDNTMTTAQYMELATDFFMSGIYDVLQNVYALLLTWGEKIGLGKEDIEAKQKAMRNVKDRSQEASQIAVYATAQRKKAETEVKTAKTDEEKAAAEAKVQDARKFEADAIAQRERVMRSGENVASATPESDTAKMIQGGAQGVRESFLGYVPQVQAYTRMAEYGAGVGLEGGAAGVRASNPLTSLDTEGKMMLAKSRALSGGKQISDMSPAEKEMTKEGLGINDEQLSALQSLETAWNNTAQDAKVRDEKLAAAEEKFQKGALSVKQGEDVAAALDKSKVMNALGVAGFKGKEAEDMFSKIREGRTPIKLADKLLGDPALREKVGGLDLGSHRGTLDSLLNVPKGGDFLLRMDSETGRMTPLVEMDRADNLSVIGAKPGGAASRVGKGGGGGGGGGAVVVNNHFYQDAKGNYTQAKKLYSAMSRGR